MPIVHKLTAAEKERNIFMCVTLFILYSMVYKSVMYARNPNRTKGDSKTWSCTSSTKEKSTSDISIAERQSDRKQFSIL